MRPAKIKDCGCRMWIRSGRPYLTCEYHGYLYAVVEAAKEALRVLEHDNGAPEGGTTDQARKNLRKAIAALESARKESHGK